MVISLHPSLKFFKFKLDLKKNPLKDGGALNPQKQAAIEELKVRTENEVRNFRVEVAINC